MKPKTKFKSRPYRTVNNSHQGSYAPIVHAPQIVFEDKDYLVINKPAGMIVNKSLTTKGQLTLQDWVEKYLRGESLPWALRSGLVHRLDKETTGLMVVAKSEPAYYHLLAQFKQRLVRKKYIALVHGLLRPKNGTVCLPIKRDPRNRKKFSVYVGGKMAETHYRVKQYWQNPKQKIKSKKYFSLVEVDLKTGRTHQIRVHFSHLRHPVVADTVYAGKKTSRSDRSWVPHLFLQSIFLSFVDHNHKEHHYSLSLTELLQKGLEEKLQPAVDIV